MPPTVGIRQWTAWRVTAKDGWMKKAYTDIVIAPTSTIAIEACKQNYGGIIELQQWRAKAVGHYDAHKIAYLGG